MESKPSNKSKQEQELNMHGRKTLTKTVKRIPWLSNNFLMSTYEVLKFFTKAKLYKTYNFIFLTLPFHMKRKQLSIFTCSYFLVLIVFSLGSILFFDIKISSSDAITFYTAAGAMTGGIVAILFTLTVVLVNNAIEKLPSGMYKIALDIFWREVVLFAIISFSSLSAFIAALLYGNVGSGLSEIGFAAIIFIIGLVFYSTFYFYLFIKEALNPINVLNKAYNQSVSKLSSVSRLAERTSSILLEMPKNKTVAMSKEQALAASFQMMGPYMDEINYRISYLFDYHDMVVGSKNRTMALTVLDRISRIYCQYFEVRKDSSIMLPSREVLLGFESDSQSFLTKGLERLVSTGANYLTENDEPGLTKVIETFNHICIASSGIKYVGNIMPDNPIFHQCRFYFDSLVGKIVEVRSFEGLFQAAVAYKSIGNVAIKEGLVTQIPTIIDKIKSISFAGAISNQEVVLKQVMNTLDYLMFRMPENKNLDFSIEFKPIMNAIEEIISFSHACIAKGLLKSNYYLIDDLALPINNLPDFIRYIAQIYENTDARYKNHYAKIIIETADLLFTFMRDLADKFKNPNLTIVKIFADSIGEVGLILLQLSRETNWSVHEKEIISEVESLPFLSGWFTHDAKEIKNDNSLRGIIDFLTNIGLKAIELKEENTAINCLKQLINLSNKLLEKEKDGYGYSEPRTMGKACQLGILAIKYEMPSILELIVKEIPLFEAKYIKKYFKNLPLGVKKTSPSKGQLLYELLGLLRKSERRGFDRKNRLIDDFEDKLLDSVATSEIEDFIARIWGKKPIDDFRNTVTTFS